VLPGERGVAWVVVEDVADAVENVRSYSAVGKLQCCRQQQPNINQHVSAISLLLLFSLSLHSVTLHTLFVCVFIDARAYDDFVLVIFLLLVYRHHHDHLSTVAVFYVEDLYFFVCFFHPDGNEVYVCLLVWWQPLLPHVFPSVTQLPHTDSLIQQFSLYSGTFFFLAFLREVSLSEAVFFPRKEIQCVSNDRHTSYSLIAFLF